MDWWIYLLVLIFIVLIFSKVLFISSTLPIHYDNVFVKFEQHVKHERCAQWSISMSRQCLLAEQPLWDLVCTCLENWSWVESWTRDGWMKIARSSFATSQRIACRKVFNSSLWGAIWSDLRQINPWTRPFVGSYLSKWLFKHGSPLSFIFLVWTTTVSLQNDVV